MSRAASRVCIVMSRFPRVSGDEPPVSLLFHALMPFSPRERG